MEYSHSPEHEEAHVGWTTTTRLVVVVFLLILFGLSVFAFRVIVVPLVIASIMAFILYPVVNFVSRVTRIPHGLATGFIYLILLAGVIVLVAFVTPLVIDQVRRFQEKELQDLISFLSSVSDDSFVVLGVDVGAQSVVNEITTALQDLARSAATDIVNIAFDVVETVLLTVFVFLMGFYLTRDADKFWGWARALIPPDYKRDGDLLLAELDTVWTAFFRGQLILATVVAAIVTLVATGIGLPRPILWGIFAGLMEFLPSIGHAIWGTSAVLVALLEGSTTLPVSNFVFMLIVVGVLVVFTQFDLNFLIPRIIGAQVHLHPMVIIIGIIIGASVSGVLGVALAAPVIASARVIGRYVYSQLFGLDPFPYAAASVPDAEGQPAVADGVEHAGVESKAKSEVKAQEQTL